MTTTQTQAETIVEKLNALGVSCRLVGYLEGPQICRAEVEPAGNSRMIDFRRLSRADDLAYAIGARSVRIAAPIPGKSAIGIEWDRPDRQTVDFGDLPRIGGLPPTLTIGLDVEGRPTLLPVAEMPHALVAGQTGAGKTSMLHTVICGLVDSCGPESVRLCLVDPKRTEFAAYESLPHLLFPVADDPEAALQQLHALVLNMQDRYTLLRALGARDIREANEKLAKRGSPTLPYFVCIIDEYAELVLTSRKEVEALVIRLAQKARAVGIHLIVATQYPKSDILSGLVRVNLPTKCCFAVPDATASRVVLDHNGGEALLGKGDGLMKLAGLPATRFQAAYTSPEKVAEIVSKWTTERTETM